MTRNTDNGWSHYRICEKPVTEARILLTWHRRANLGVSKDWLSGSVFEYLPFSEGSLSDEEIY